MRPHTEDSGLLQPAEPLHGFDGPGQGLLGLELTGHRVRGWEVAKLTQPVLGAGGGKTNTHSQVNDISWMTSIMAAFH